MGKKSEDFSRIVWSFSTLAQDMCSAKGVGFLIANN
jgi:hypothetical protein